MGLTNESTSGFIQSELPNGMSRADAETDRNFTRIDTNYRDPSKPAIFVWRDGTVTRWWSDADPGLVYLPSNCSKLFHECTGSNFTSLDLTSFNASRVTNMASMFGGVGANSTNAARQLRYIDISGWDTSNVRDMSGMFNLLNGLLSIKGIEYLDTHNVTDMNCMFRLCNYLNSETGMLDLSHPEGTTIWDVSKVTNMQEMFSSAFVRITLPAEFPSGLVMVPSTTLNLAGWDPRSVRNTHRMFENHTYNTTNDSLTTILTDRNWNTYSVADSVDMFEMRYKLVGGGGYVAKDSDTIAQAFIGTDRYGGLFTRGVATAKTPQTVEIAVPPSPEEGDGQKSNSVIYSGDDPANAYGEWVQNADGSWTYRFRVFERDSTYYVWEGDMAGFVAVDENGNAIGPGAYTTYITLPYEAGDETNPGHAETTIRNRKNSELVNLYLYKYVNGTGATGVDRNRDFTFTIRLTGVPSDEVTYGDVTFINGAATVTLKDAQRKAITGLPQGVGYTITEAPAEDFKTYVNGAQASTASGVISNSGATVSVFFTNVKDATELIVGKTLLVDENVEGLELTEEDLERQFTFRVTIYTDSEKTTVDTDINGVYGDLLFVDGVATAYLKHDETLRAIGLPEGAVYSVEETLSAEDADIYDPEVPEDASGTLTPGVPVTVTIGNRKTRIEKFNGFTLEKHVEGVDNGEAFPFTVNFSGLRPETTYSYTVHRISGDGTAAMEAHTFTSGLRGAANLTLDLANGEKVQFADLPIGAKYRVTESGVQGYTASYIITDANPDNDDPTANILYASGEGQPGGELYTGQETVDEDEIITVAFTNTSRKYEVPFAKVDPQDSFVAGAELALYRRTPRLDGNGLQVVEGGVPQFDELLIESWISEPSQHVVSLMPGDYVLRETGVPDGYFAASEILFTLNVDGTLSIDGSDETTNVISMVDEPTEIAILKRDAQSDPPRAVSGATLWILDSENVKVYEWVSSSRPERISGVLKPGEVYCLREIYAPEANGYTLAEDDIFFMIDEQGVYYSGSDASALTRVEPQSSVLSGNTYNIAMDDPWIRGGLTVDKVLLGNAPEADRAFEVSVRLASADGATSITQEQLIAAGVTAAIDETPIENLTIVNGVITASLKGDQTLTFENLIPGWTYEVTEADYAEDGYLTSYENATGDIGRASTTEATVFNARNEVKVHKVDPSGEALSGATFKLMYVDGPNEEVVYDELVLSTDPASVGTGSFVLPAQVEEWLETAEAIAAQDINASPVVVLRLYETAAPDGHILRRDPWTIEIGRQQEEGVEESSHPGQWVITMTSPDGTVVTADEDTESYALENVPLPQVELKKIQSGTSVVTITNEDDESIPFTGTKIDDDRTPGLQGAEFALYREVEGGTEGAVRLTGVPGGSDGPQNIWVLPATNLGGGSLASLRTNGQGSFSFGALEEGTYWLVEKTAPGGYKKAKPTRMMIGDKSNVAHSAIGVSYQNDGMFAGQAQDAYARTEGLTTIYTIVLENTPEDLVLPHTGGMGKTTYYAAGLALIALALMGYKLNRRRQRS